METYLARQMKLLEEESCRLKSLIADLSLDKKMLTSRSILAASKLALANVTSTSSLISTDAVCQFNSLPLSKWPKEAPLEGEC